MRRIWAIAGVVSTAVLAGGLPAIADDALLPGSGPAVDIDWSVGLRGAYTSNSITGGSAEARIAPELSIESNGARSTTTFASGGELAVDDTGAVHFDKVHASAGSTFQLDEVSNLSGNLDLSLIQLRPGDTTLPANTLIGPLEFTGTATGIATRKLGQFDVTGTLAGKRFIEGETTLDDHSVVDNSASSYWQGAAELRVGYEFTPLVSIFIDGTESYQKFDAASPSLLKFLDGRTTTLRGGLSYARDTTLKAEASAGIAWLDYDDASLKDTPSWVYDASLTFNPDETMSLVGSLDTTLGPSDTVPGDTDVDYALTGTAKYEVNPWLTLRGSAGFSRTLTLGTGDDTWGYTAGGGLDLNSSRHVVWSADYLFAHDEPVTGSPSDTHTVTVGVTVKR